MRNLNCRFWNCALVALVLAVVKVSAAPVSAPSTKDANAAPVSTASQQAPTNPTTAAKPKGSSTPDGPPASTEHAYHADSEHDTAAGEHHPAAGSEHVHHSTTEAQQSAGPASGSEAAGAPANQDAAATTSTPAQPAGPEPVPQAPLPPEFHRVQMRLSGSMCASCLHDMEVKVRRLPGVARIKITHHEVGFVLSASPDVTSWADGIIVYDSAKINWYQIKHVLKLSGYHPYQVQDRALGAGFNPESAKL